MLTNVLFNDFQSMLLQDLTKSSVTEIIIFGRSVATSNDTPLLKLSMVCPFIKQKTSCILCFFFSGGGGHSGAKPQMLCNEY